MAYHVRTKEFDGPLEVLLNLIESRKLSINEISLGAVTEEYFEYLKVLKNETGDTYHKEIAVFLVIAATLMLIKSRSLLPGFSITPEEEADIKELEGRLRTYKLVKEAAAILGKRVEGRHQLYTRAPFVAAIPAFLPPSKPLDLPRMLGILKSALATIPPKQDLPQQTVKKIISLEEKIKELERRIADGMVKTFEDFVGDKKEKFNIIVSFLAMLELVKLGTIAVEQSRPFTNIRIEYGA
jgi:segregation and condensation protein A